MEEMALLMAEEPRTRQDTGNGLFWRPIEENCRDGSNGMRLSWLASWRKMRDLPVALNSPLLAYQASMHFLFGLSLWSLIRPRLEQSMELS